MAHVSFKNVSVIYLSVARQHLVVFLPELCVRQIFPRHPRPVSAAWSTWALLSGDSAPWSPGPIHDIKIDDVPQQPAPGTEKWGGRMWHLHTGSTPPQHFNETNVHVCTLSSCVVMRHNEGGAQLVRSTLPCISSEIIHFVNIAGARRGTETVTGARPASPTWAAPASSTRGWRRWLVRAGAERGTWRHVWFLQPLNAPSTSLK